VEERGFELDKCSRSKRASLDSIAASRAFSLLSCFIRCSTPGSRRQLSVDKNERHRGNDEPDAPLLRELEGGAGGEGDVVIGGEQSDQGDHEAGESLDPALAIEAAAVGRERRCLRGRQKCGFWFVWEPGGPTTPDVGRYR
jgi:hypothetical protein